jgi:hypothetical protein
MSDKRMYEQVKRPFTDDEIRKLGELLARESQNLIDIREQKTATVAGFAAAIKVSLKAQAELALKINNRYELTEVEVMPMMDTPRPGKEGLHPRG